MYARTQRTLYDGFRAAGAKPLARRLRVSTTLMLVVAFMGCNTTNLSPLAEEPPARSSEASSSSVVVPPAPPIYATGMTWQQGHHAQKIGVPLALVEGQLVGDDPLWNFSDLFDGPKAATAINLALRSNEDTEVSKVGSERALLFLQRLRLLNSALSDLTKAGVLAPPIHNVYSGREFRSKIGTRLRGICAGVSGYPEISRGHVKWLYQLANIADPNKAADIKNTTP